MGKYTIKGGIYTSCFEPLNKLEDFYTTLTSTARETYSILNYLQVRFLSIKHENKKRNTGFWAPLNFMNVLFDQIDIINKHLIPSELILRHLELIILPPLEKYVLLSSLLYYFDRYQIPVQPDVNDDAIDDILFEYVDAFDSIYKLFKKEYQSLNCKVHPIYHYVVQEECLPYLGFIWSKLTDSNIELEDENKPFNLKESVDKVAKEMGVDLKEYAIEIPLPNKPLTRSQKALFYFYLQDVKIFGHFENMEGGKEKAIKMVAKRNGVSWKSFQQCYNFISRNKEGRDNRLSNVNNIKEVIKALENYPKAQNLAKDELNLAYLRSIS